jgi:hypothetical protein
MKARTAKIQPVQEISPGNETEIRAPKNAQGSQFEQLSQQRPEILEGFALAGAEGGHRDTGGEGASNRLAWVALPTANTNKPMVKRGAVRTG